MKHIKYILVMILLVISQTLWAQHLGTTTSSGKNFRRGVAAVMFSTIGGAVLGLSTLSFYGQPQEHTGNITMGALVGLAAGITYVTYDAGRNPQPTSGTYDYSETELQESKTKKMFLMAQGQGAPLFVINFSIN